MPLALIYKRRGTTKQSDEWIEPDWVRRSRESFPTYKYGVTYSYRINNSFSSLAGPTSDFFPNKRENIRYSYLAFQERSRASEGLEFF